MTTLKKKMATSMKSLIIFRNLTRPSHGCERLINTYAGQNNRIFSQQRPPYSINGGLWRRLNTFSHQRMLLDDEYRNRPISINHNDNGLNLGSTNRFISHTSSNCSRLYPTDDELYGDRTTISILSKEYPEMLQIGSYSPMGFNIGGNRIVGPVAVIPHGLLFWNVGCWEDINEDSLCVFHMLHPQIEILVVGTGDKYQRLPKEVHAFMWKKGVSLEVQDTPNACATYNYLNSEGRTVAAALIPPNKVSL